VEDLLPLPESKTEAPTTAAGHKSKDEFLAKAKEMVVKEPVPQAKALPENVNPERSNDHMSAEGQPAERPLNRG
jgi:hypothetical protein